MSFPRTTEKGIASLTIASPAGMVTLLSPQNVAGVLVSSTIARAESALSATNTRVIVTGSVPQKLSRVIFILSPSNIGRIG